MAGRGCGASRICGGLGPRTNIVRGIIVVVGIGIGPSLDCRMHSYQCTRISNSQALCFKGLLRRLASWSQSCGCRDRQKNTMCEVSVMLEECVRQQTVPQYVCVCEVAGMLSRGAGRDVVKTPIDLAVLVNAKALAFCDV